LQTATHSSQMYALGRSLGEDKSLATWFWLLPQKVHLSVSSADARAGCFSESSTLSKSPGEANHTTSSVGKAEKADHVSMIGLHVCC